MDLGLTGLERVFRCCSVSETVVKEYYKEGYLMVWANMELDC